MSGPDHRIYAQCGLRIRSELDLALPRVGGDEWDIDVCWGGPTGDEEPPAGTTIAQFGPDDDPWYSGIRTDQGHCLRFRDTGDIWISPELDEITVRPDPAGRPELLPILVAGTATAFLLALRGTTVLHASAVAVDGVVLAFVGQSGQGKSTLAAMLCADGAALVTDDVLAIDPGPPARCTGGAHELRLRDKARSLLDGRADTSTRVTADDRLAYAPDAVDPGPLPLAAVIVPAPSRDVIAVESQRLEPAAAMMTLLSSPRVHGWTDHDVLQRDFAAVATLVNHVPVLTALIPWGPPFEPAVVADLAAEALRH